MKYGLHSVIFYFKYRFCISVIGYMQIIGIGYKKNQYWPITNCNYEKYNPLQLKWMQRVHFVL